MVVRLQRMQLRQATKRFPLSVFLVSYESYRTIFNTKFHIGFGYPRKDTCSVCHHFIVKVQYFAQIAEAQGRSDEIAALNGKKGQIWLGPMTSTSVRPLRSMIAKLQQSKEGKTV